MADARDVRPCGRRPAPPALLRTPWARRHVRRRSSPRRTTTAPPSASCSGTRTGSRRPAATGPSRWAGGPWTPGSSCGRERGHRRPDRRAFRPRHGPRPHRAGTVTSVDFINVASYVLAESVPVVTSRGQVVVDIGYGGAIYAQLPAGSRGPHGRPRRPAAAHRHRPGDQVGAERQRARPASERRPPQRHLRDDPLRRRRHAEGPGGPNVNGAVHQRNVTVFADGEVDRSPCGSGTCARLAALTASGRLSAGQELVHDSIVGSRFRARVVDQVTVEGRAAIVPLVTGTAFRTGEHTFVVDPADDLVPGFVLR